MGSPAEQAGMAGQRKVPGLAHSPVELAPGPRWSLALLSRDGEGKGEVLLACDREKVCRIEFQDQMFLETGPERISHFFKDVQQVQR